MQTAINNINKDYNIEQNNKMNNEDPESFHLDENVVINLLRAKSKQPRSQGLFPGLRVGREKVLASAGHLFILHPEILGVIN